MDMIGWRITLALQGRAELNLSRFCQIRGIVVAYYGYQPDREIYDFVAVTAREYSASQERLWKEQLWKDNIIDEYPLTLPRSMLIFEEKLSEEEQLTHSNFFVRASLNQETFSEVCKNFIRQRTRQ